MSDFEIRPLGPGDAETAIAALDALLPPDWREGALPSRGRMREVLGDASIILIAAHADNGAAAGYVSGNLLPATHRDGTVAMLDDLFVAEAFRNRGLGRRLVEAFKERVRECAKAPVAIWSGTGVDNAPCRRAFEAAGGTADEETYKEYGWRKI